MLNTELAPSVLWRALRLRCPRCGRGAFLAHGVTPHNECQVCGLRFVREDGYWTGAMYVNLIATQFVIVGGLFVLMFGINLPLTTQIVSLAVAGVLFPIVFYPVSKSLWLAMDYFFTGDEWAGNTARGDHSRSLDSRS